uniref:N-acetyltransferase domain-containing protein n=1 Tax=Mucochytrium quahogii TaxID=96639 RepID=A0A7S2RUM3_9STRA|mmetsp:Transcript_9631/g.15792  ORF Transcript_9631/g.15792 Transcript_9631/m.15792 type:complete len:299 (+) Transcript_9631:117-1013(+)|eukprot:CAMPEP_0203758684 /NCGR_PEP_ID=MMETSP0098-20131031/11514_1 /ASSEMBLY_ACC=CAM_ASM_000208 /TAXON_ID=96639 /ORGANISM=" , Strain NY0313808BC1" /LENGTH=298 /DNA_ID=CAMNT_0050651227 /DNA_START=96 /DNA_END=992 /DNA_ORIENTATION=-
MTKNCQEKWCLNLDDALVDARVERIHFDTKEAVDEAVGVMVRSFAGSESSFPEGTLDWILGPECRAKGDDKLYGFVTACPKERQEIMEIFMTFTAYQAQSNGLLLGVRDQQTKTLLGVIALRRPQSTWSLVRGFNAKKAYIYAGYNTWKRVDCCDKAEKNRRFAWEKGNIGKRVHLAGEELRKGLEFVMGTRPHWFISSLAVDPNAQGKGVGRALLNITAALAKRDNLPIYLEASGSKNKSYYTRYGFNTKLCIETMSIDDPTASPYAHEGGLNLMVYTGPPAEQSKKIIEAKVISSN